MAPVNQTQPIENLEEEKKTLLVKVWWITAAVVTRELSSDEDLQIVEDVFSHPHLQIIRGKVLYRDTDTVYVK